MSITKNIQLLQAELPQGVRLVAVSKYHPNEAILEAYNAGQRVFGESKVQEMVAKYEALPKDIEWHFIGHLQTNKVKYIVGKASLIHSIDSEKLLFAVNDRAKSLNLVQSVLLEVNIANDENKHGFNKQDLFKAISSAQNCDNLNIQGLMTVLPKCENKDNLCELCLQMRSLYDIIKESQPNFCTLSMGMSGDYQTAIQNGSNLIRIGSLLFGERKYNKNGD